MAQPKVAVLGSGTVGETLANGFLKHNYQVLRASRDPRKLADWHSKAQARHGSAVAIGNFEEAARFGELVVLAVKGTAADSVLKLCGPANLKGKIIIDTTNPIADEPPVHGVLKFFTGHNQSLMERNQQIVPLAHFVKCFSSVGASQMINPDFGPHVPTMFICGNSFDAKTQVVHILGQFGWDAADMGAAEAARAIEPLCMLWCIPGYLKNEWTHAFKLLRHPAP